MLRRLKISSRLIASLCLLLLCGCATVYNPATKRREALLINTKSEVSMGRDMDREARKKYKILDDYTKRGRLYEIGLKVADVSDRKDLAYHFYIIDGKDFNAFTIPGGYIYVNSGLMDAATDDELACVLGHEIGHTAARHAVKQLQANLGYQLIMNIAVGVTGQQAMAQAMDIVYNLATLGYSRGDENLADKLAVKYARRSGYDPRAMITFFRKLQKEAEKKGGSLPIEIFNSHPDIETRIKNIEKEIAATS